MAATKELLQMDLYGLLEVDERASSKAIKKAYRQKALKCHPDKNPDNPKAADLFHQLSQALEVLTDAAARAAYDKVRAAKRQAEERTRRLDDKRKKIKLDLEARERQAEYQHADEVKVTRTLEEEIARLREEGSRQLQEEQRIIQEQVEREKKARLHTDCSHTDGGAGCGSGTPKLKLKWKSKKEDENNGGYSQEFLLSLLKKYGDVLNVLISTKKKGSAVVEFASTKAADLAFKNESGLMGNPLKISWLEGQPEAPPVTTHTSDPGSMFTQASLTSGRDYESLVLMRMRQAAERQRLIDEMQKEDDDDEEAAATSTKAKAKA
ncbi:dnaJ homolog subfamily C member 17 isoform X2 [Clupea harengus]|uniref:DnaJ homolog subfamily C member 17 n=1 Tax=Clupea harengus TaxID=7950 RepID=A0A6P3W8T0_CLUHA|nr:dnaJ homolog subfamily C member 17 isoform X2 [Clupea harengus]